MDWTQKRERPVGSEGTPVSGAPREAQRQGSLGAGGRASAGPRALPASGSSAALASSLLAFALFFFFCFSRAAPTAYGGSQARGRIGAVAAGLRRSHSTVGSEPCLQPVRHSSRQHQILNPLCEARARTCNLMVPSRIRFCCNVSFLFMAAPAAHGSCHARGHIRAAATGLYHSNTESLTH